MSKRPVLYLPIEIKAREFLGKIFLAARAVERGWLVVMGDQSDVWRYMQDAPPGAYIEISVPESKTARLEKFSKAGHRIFNLCEESLIYANGRDYCDRKLGMTALRSVDRMLVLGSKNAEHIRAHRPQFADRVAVTGNPRFDMLLPGMRDVYAQQASDIRHEYGRFLLVNTNFGRANPQNPNRDLIGRLKRLGMIRDEGMEAFNRRFSEYKKRQMQGFRHMLAQIAASGAVDRIVVRPHPGESPQSWTEWGRPLGIDTRYEGTANEWILAAEAVLHPGCTTGIEALLLDRQTFTYVPEPDSEFLNPSDMACPRVATADEFLGRLATIRSGDGAKQSREMSAHRATLDPFIANAATPYATDRILDELERFDIPPVTQWQAGLSDWSALAWARGRLRQWLGRTAGMPSAGKRQKFSGMSLNEIQAPVEKWIAAGALADPKRVTFLNNRLCAWH